jgi:uncharacterized protein YecT (DUF1311 family)
MKVIKTTLALIVATAALSVTIKADQTAEESRLKDAQESCKPAGSQQELNACAAADYYKADLEMNRLYSTQMARLSEPEKSRLRDSQRAWIVFRDKACAYEVPSESPPGSIYPMAANMCLAAHTTQRVKDLRRYLSCTENGCPE